MARSPISTEVHAVGLYGSRRRRHRRTATASDDKVDVIQGHARQGIRARRRLYRGVGGRSSISVRSYAQAFIFTSALPPAVAGLRDRQRAPCRGAHELRRRPPGPRDRG